MSDLWSKAGQTERERERRTRKDQIDTILRARKNEIKDFRV